MLEVPAPARACCANQVQGGATVTSGQLLAMLETGGRRATSPGLRRRPPPRRCGREAAAPAADRGCGAPASWRPAARRLVDEHRLDPATIAGTGRDGRIIKEDVLPATCRAAPPAAPAAARRLTRAARDRSRWPASWQWRRGERRVP